MKRAFSVALFFIFCLSLVAQNESSDTISSDLLSRIKILEDKFYFVEMHKENIDDRFKNKSDELDLEIKRIESELKQDYDFLKKFAWIFGSVTIIGGLYLAYGIYRFILETAKDKVDKKFDEFFENEKDKLIRIIDKQVSENRIKSEMRITVVSPETEDDSFLRKFFKLQEFKYVNYKSTDCYLEPKSNINLIFINNESNSYSDEIIKEYIDNKDNKLVFILCSRNLRSDYLSKNNVAFSNSRIQIYGNLLNALRYESVRQVL